METLLKTKFRPGLLYLAKLQRPRGVTSIDALQRTGMSRKDALELMRKLEADSRGVVVVGRRGGRTRLEWWENLVPVAKAAVRAGAPRARAVRKAKAFEKRAQADLRRIMKKIYQTIEARP